MKTALSLRLSDGAKRNGAKIILLLSTVLWGSSYFILKDTLDEVPPYFLLSFRFLVAAVLLGWCAGRSGSCSTAAICGRAR